MFSGITDYADKKVKINTTLYGVNGTKANPTGGLYLTLYGNKTTKGLLTVEEEKEQQEAFSLEKAFEQLEETIGQLEQEDISLEKSFEIYQAGMKLLKKCNESIDRVEKQVLVLQEDGTTYELS